MTPTQFRSEQESYGLGDKDCARLVGVRGDRTVRGWKQGRNAVPGSVVRLLYLLRVMDPKSRAAMVKKLMEMK